MIPFSAAASVLGTRAARRVLACGCGAGAVVVALPVLVIVSMVSHLVPFTGGATNQVDAAGGLVMGTAQPLAAGQFRVSQGFGCTDFASEPLPPPGYSCPPDAAHAGYRWFHTGVDMAAARGTPVYAAVDGAVQVVESTVGFGVHILLVPSAAPSGGVVYLYGHLDGVAVPDGDVVRAGDPIGYVGSTGNSTGPHLHFEVDRGGIPVNPCSIFPRGYLVPAGVAATDCLAWAA